MVDHRVGWLDPLFVGLSVVGFAGLLWIALAPVLAILWRRPLLTATALTALCVWTADLLALAVKSLTDRARPFDALPEVDPLLGGTVGGSLPSGHAATSFAGAIVLSRFFPRALPAFIALALAVSYSRVYVGVHYVSDIVVGAALGTVVAVAILAALRLRQPTSAAPPRSGATPPGG